MKLIIVLLFMLFPFNAQSVATCGGNCETPPSCTELGYKQNIVCPEGSVSCPFDSSYKWCKQYTCEDGRYSSDILDIKSSYSCTAVKYHGLNCYDCICAADETVCKWTLANAGEATLDEKCCNNKFQTCISNCLDTVKVPENAEAVTSPCASCGTTKPIITDFKCLPSYELFIDKCVAKPCDSGFSIAYTEVADCGIKGSLGWIFETSGLSGTDICGKCTTKTCPSGESIDNGSCGNGSGWNRPLTGNFSGDKACYSIDCTCEKTCKWNDGNKNSATLNNVCCDGNFETCTSTCAAVTVPTNAHSTGTCTGCDVKVDTAWECNDGYKENDTQDACIIATCDEGCAVDIVNCGTSGSTGWSFGANCNLSGTAQCKTCTAKSCPSGSEITSEVSTCGYPATKYASKPTNGSFAGDDACYACKCEAPVTCKWDDTNKGTAAISSQCCNGKYETCTSTCVEVTVPANATATATCNGCEKTVNTAWKCNDGYTQTGDTCAVATCNAGCATEITKCGTTGDKGWSFGANCNLSGAAQCKTCTAKSCLTGSDTNSAVSTCGYPAARHASKPANGSYNGDDACYACKCEAPIACKWTASNKGTANISDQCCNGNYETCTSTCVEVTVPTNATATATCNGCEKTVNTAWKCNDGYTQTDNLCKISTCPANSGTIAADCGNQGDKGWTLGANTGSLSGSTPCKTCIKKDCLAGSDINSALSTCGYPATKYASKPANGSYNGDNACYACKCEAPAACKWTAANKGTADISGQCCNGNYETCTSTCAAAVTVPANATATASCTSCGTTVDTAWKCNDGYTQIGDTCAIATCNAGCATAITSCGSSGDKGWSFGANCNLSGVAQCKTCVAKTCPSGSDTNNAVASCGYPATRYASKPANDSFAGNSACYACKCEAPIACKWTASNEGTANLTNQCCNGNYETCTSTCGEAVTVPANAHSTANCTSCGTTVDTAWECNDGYVMGYGRSRAWDNPTCVPATCNSGCAAALSGCGSSGDKGWSFGANCNLSGIVQCKTCVAKTCPSGSDTNSSVSTCGYPATRYASKNANGSFAGNEACYSCLCAAPSNSCKWTDANKGSGNISNQCCNGNYETCTDTCADTISLPANADAVYSSCAGCGITSRVITDFVCRTGYVKSGSSCVEASCPSGFSTAYSSASSCGSTGSNGWTFSSSGYSGTNICGKCTAKTCASGSTSYSNVANCGSSGSSGWTSSTNGYYSGNSACYTCSAKTCPSGYSTAYSSVSNCGSNGSNGWSYASSGYSGNSICGKCTAKYCTAGDTNASVSTCGYPSTRHASKPFNGYYYGNTTCHSCECTAPPACKWTASSNQNESLSSQCCNGKYETCSSNCVPATIPANATATATCTGCGTTVNTDWACNTGYVKSGSSCVPASCPSGSSTSYSNVANCGSSGASGWTSSANGYYSGGSACYTCSAKTCPSGFSTAYSSVSSCGAGGASGWNFTSSGHAGNSVCGKCTIKTCPSGSDTNSSVSSCGYPATKHASKRLNGSYNGNSPCYVCECNAPSYCQWTASSNQNESLSSQCCNGKYETCTSNCTAVTVPANAHSTANCTSCGTTVDTDWECNLGYVISGNNCVLASCPSLSATDVNKCGKTGATGWVLGAANGSYSGPSPCYTCEAKDCSNCQNFMTGECGLGGVVVDVPTCTSGDDVKCAGQYCICNAVPSDCKYDASNVGTGTLSGQKCCDGSYTDCISFSAISPSGPTHCTSYNCDGEICSKYECDSGYKEIPNVDNGGFAIKGSRCVPDCPSGSATAANECGTGGSKGWYLGNTSTGIAAGKTCYKCMKNLCTIDYSASNCITAIPSDTDCWSGDDRLCKILLMDQEPSCCTSGSIFITTWYKGSSCYTSACIGCKKCGGGTIQPIECDFDCSNCGGLRCSSVGNIGSCYCMATAKPEPVCPYDCSNCGGKSCSTSSTYLGCACRQAGSGGGGGIITPSCPYPYDCSNCGGTSCSSVSSIGGCLCWRTAIVEKNIPSTL